METPSIRPGKVAERTSGPVVVAFFSSSAMGNSAIQLLTAIGVPGTHLGVTPPEQINGQGMVLSIGCPDDKLLHEVESTCRKLGAVVHRQSRVS